MTTSLFYWYHGAIVKTVKQRNSHITSNKIMSIFKLDQNMNKITIYKFSSCIESSYYIKLVTVLSCHKC